MNHPRFPFISILIATMLLFGDMPFAAAQKNNAKSKSNAVTEEHHDNLNKRDAKGRKQGIWFNRQEPLRGEPGYMEFGSYQDDRKTGLWYKLDDLARLMAIENFTKGVLNGESQYYDKGRLVCIGNYRGLNPDSKFDSFYVTNPLTYLDSMVVIPSERGSLKHGLWRYYDPLTGQLKLEEEYQVDDLIRKKEFFISSTEDSSYIKKREDELPHNQHPRGIKPSHKPPKYSY